MLGCVAMVGYGAMFDHMTDLLVQVLGALAYSLTHLLTCPLTYLTSQLPVQVLEVSLPYDTPCTKSDPYSVQSVSK